MSSPWRALAARPHLTLIHWPIPEFGRYYPERGVIVLRRGLRLVEQRSVLWHELVHADRGDLECDGRHGQRQEAACHREAARRAIDVYDLADALCWSDDPHEVADQLRVTVEMLHTRRAHLHPSEAGVIRRQLSLKEMPA